MPLWLVNPATARLVRARDVVSGGWRLSVTIFDVTELPPLEPAFDASDIGAAPGGEAGDNGFDEADVDPWPARCEMVATALVATALLLVLAAALYGWSLNPPDPSGAPSGLLRQPSTPAIYKLRAAADYLGTFPGLFALGGVFSLAVDSITSGERRRPVTRLGRPVLWVAIITAGIVAVAAAARIVDILRGQISPISNFPGSGWPFRISVALDRMVALIPALAAVAVGWWALDDVALAEIDEGVPVSPDTGPSWKDGVSAEGS